MNKRTLTMLITLGVGLVALALVWQSRYNIYDFIVLRNYTPTTAISELATASSLNDYGKRLFYVNDPQLLDRKQFAENCKVREQTIVLGCFNGVGIYVFDVNDDRLNGVEEVTAAHEMLHAAYERLSPSERKKIDTLTATAYSKINDPELAKRIDAYKVSEPGEIPNELHSILGTEVRNIGAELEQYYAKYFISRLTVVALAEKYEKVFVDIKNEVQQLDADLTLRKAEIDRREQALQGRSAELQAQRRQLDAYYSSRNYTAYNNAVSSYNSAVNSYNSEIAAVKDIIYAYNNLVQTRNSLTEDQESLVKSLDSRLDTISNE